MLDRSLKAVGGVAGGAGVYGSCLYDLPFLTAAICLLVGLALVWLGMRLEPATPADSGRPSSRHL